MMLYEAATVQSAFSIFRLLTRDGKAGTEHYHTYLTDDDVRGLLDEFIRTVDCDLITVGQELLMIPTTGDSPFHVSNEYLRKTYLKTQATNADLYLLYFSTIVLLGEFYNSYTSKEPTKDFLPMAEWVQAVQQRIDALNEHSEEDLAELASEFSYNWPMIIEKWNQMDDLQEQAKRQSGNTVSRLSFLDTVRRFLVDQQLIADIGNYEVELTEKAKTVVQRYFMDSEFNRGILDFLYRFENDGEEVNSNAGNLED
ncbi:DUF6063 family protein [Sporosarcina contaminans]|uniref:DUF6063 family protein n=2 Tax=Sporosarcina TaxID=1569 RepID=A0ABW3U2F4_9BACL